MIAADTRPLWRGRIAAVLGTVLVAATMRSAVGALSPILEQVGRDIPLSTLVLSVIGASAPLAFAVSGLVTPGISRLLGLEAALIGAIAVGGAGHLIRGLAQDPGTLLAGTVLALVGAGSANVLLPPIVKRFFPDRIGTMSAVYITVMSAGSAVPPAVAVPVADAAGWRVSLGSWALLTAAALVPWVWQLLRNGRHVEQLDTAARGLEAAQAGIGARLLRSPTAWSMALLFGFSAIVTYTVFGWLPEIVFELSGIGRVEAGFALALFGVVGVPAGLLVPLLTVRIASPVAAILVSQGFFGVGFAGFLVAPAAAPLLWSLCIGVGSAVFPMILTLINVRTRTQAGSVALSGFVQGVGYGIGALGPLVTGILHDVTGSWAAAMWFLIASMVLAIPSLVVLRRFRYVEDEVARRPRDGSQEPGGR